MDGQTNVNHADFIHISTYRICCRCLYLERDSINITLGRLLQTIFYFGVSKRKTNGEQEEWMVARNHFTLIMIHCIFRQ